MEAKIRAKVKKEVAKTEKLAKQLHKLNSATGLKGLIISAGISKVVKWTATRQKIKMEKLLAEKAICDALDEKDVTSVSKKLEDLGDYL